jgi:predicted ATPase
VRDGHAFAHDRVQQAAYSLIPEERRGAMHLQIGRRLLRSLTRERLDERIFEVVTQLDLGRSSSADPDERVQFAELNLRAGRKDYGAAAYSSRGAACWMATWPSSLRMSYVSVKDGGVPTQRPAGLLGTV